MRSAANSATSTSSWSIVQKGGPVGYPIWLGRICTLIGLLLTATASRAQSDRPSAALRILAPAENSGFLRTTIVIRLAIPRGTTSVETGPVVRVNRQPAAYVRLEAARGVELVNVEPGDLSLRPNEEEWRLQLTLPAQDCEVSVAASADAPANVLHLRWAGNLAETTHGPTSTMYVLAVGIGSYRGDLPPLDYPRKDAHDFALALSRQRGLLYRDVVLHEIAEHEATRTRILDELLALSRRATHFDVTAIFLAGHGLLLERQYYFVPVDGSMASPASLIVSRELREAIDRIPGKALLFLDSCHAGGISEAYRERAAPGLDAALAELNAMGPGVAIFASSMAKQTSKESQTWQNGVFTKAVVEGLSGAALRDPSGIIRVLDLASYVADRVKQLTRGEQAPVLPVLLAEMGQLPLVLHAPAATLRSQTQPSAPVHKKWWFWTTIGGGVAVGGAIAIALGVTLGQSTCGSRFQGKACGVIKDTN